MARINPPDIVCLNAEFVYNVPDLGVCGSDYASTRPASSGSSCQSTDEDSFAVIYNEESCDVDCEELPQSMG